LLQQDLLAAYVSCHSWQVLCQTVMASLCCCVIDGLGVMLRQLGSGPASSCHLAHHCMQQSLLMQIAQQAVLQAAVWRQGTTRRQLSCLQGMLQPWTALYILS
jgi:hypothetical protein